MAKRLPLALALASLAVSGVALALSHPMTQSHEVTDDSSESPMLYAEIATSTAQPAATTTPSKEVQVPILVYHIVRPSYSSDSLAVRNLAVTPENFEAEMKYLADTGHHVIRFDDLETYFASSTPLPSKPVIISFDDGWADQFTYAFPILTKYHYPATFFVFTNAIGRHGFLTWDELRQMVQAGIRIGDHTRSHPYLTTITSTSTLWSEIVGSKQLLEQKLGVSVNEFAYPFGMYDENTMSLVKEAGYKSARGDYYRGDQSAGHLFDLRAMNAPTTTALLAQRFQFF